MKKKRNYGYIPDKEDDRDLLFSANVCSVSPAVKLPESVDLREFCSKIEDQGNLGSCCACSAVSLLEWAENKAGVKFIDFSKLFVYYNLRENKLKDEGGTIRGTLRSLSKQGACPEPMWTYKVSRWKTKPNAECYKAGLLHQILYYYRLYDTDEVKQCLAIPGLPVMCGIRLYESFEDENHIDPGKIPMPLRWERVSGSHAIGIYGYTKDGYFICRNSWGTGFGDKGYFYLPEAYLKKYGSDFWCVKTVEGL